jgi:hypothetical protein
MCTVGECTYAAKRSEAKRLCCTARCRGRLPTVARAVDSAQLTVSADRRQARSRAARRASWSMAPIRPPPTHVRTYCRLQHGAAAKPVVNIEMTPAMQPVTHDSLSEGLSAFEGFTLQGSAEPTVGERHCRGIASHSHSNGMSSVLLAVDRRARAEPIIRIALIIAHSAVHTAAHCADSMRRPTVGVHCREEQLTECSQRSIDRSRAAASARQLLTHGTVDSIASLRIRC